MLVTTKSKIFVVDDDVVLLTVMEELLKEDFELTVKVKPPVQEENPFASLLK